MLRGQEFKPADAKAVNWMAVAGTAAISVAFLGDLDAAVAAYRPVFSAAVYRPAPVFIAPTYHAPVFQPTYRPPVFQSAPRPIIAPSVRPLLSPQITNQASRPAIQVPNRPQPPAVVQPLVRPPGPGGASGPTGAPFTVSPAALAHPTNATVTAPVNKLGAAVGSTANSKAVGVAGTVFMAGAGSVAANAGTIAKDLAAKGLLAKGAVSNLGTAGRVADGVGLVADGVKVYGAYKTGGPGVTDRVLAGGSELSVVIAVKAAEKAGLMVGGPAGQAAAGAATQIIVDSGRTYVAPVVGGKLYNASLYPGAALDARYQQQSTAQIAQMEARLTAERNSAGSRPASVTLTRPVGGATRPMSAEEFTQIILK